MTAASWAREVLDRREVWGRAPSAHNTQPWVVRESADGLEVHWDEDRWLSVGDPTRRDLLLSLGAVAESLVIVAADLGHDLCVTWQVDVAERHAARLARREDRAAVPAFTPDDLQRRRTARSAYVEPGVSAAEMAELATAAGLDDADIGGSGARLEVLTPDLVDRMLPIADRSALDGPSAPELREWIRLRESHPRYHQDGLTDRALELSPLEARGLDLALRAPVLGVLRQLRLTRFLAEQSTARPLGTVVALTASPALSLESIGALGQLLLRTWLAAGRAGLSAHPLSQLIDCPDTAAGLAEATPGRTAYSIFRLGHSTSPAPLSARLTDEA